MKMIRSLALVCISLLSVSSFAAETITFNPTFGVTRKPGDNPISPVDAILVPGPFTNITISLEDVKTDPSSSAKVTAGSWSADITRDNILFKGQVTITKKIYTDSTQTYEFVVQVAKDGDWVHGSKMQMSTPDLARFPTGGLTGQEIQLEKSTLMPWFNIQEKQCLFECDQVDR